MGNPRAYSVFEKNFGQSSTQFQASVGLGLRLDAFVHTVDHMFLIIDTVRFVRCMVANTHLCGDDAQLFKFESMEAWRQVHAAPRIPCRAMSDASRSHPKESTRLKVRKDLGLGSQRLRLPASVGGSDRGRRLPL